jgi:hypothetical protein
MPEYGIVFAYHKTDEATSNNLESIRRHNPGVPIAMISGGEQFPGGYDLRDSARYRAETERDGIQEKKLCWRNSDVQLYEWHKVRREDCRKWFFAEWDTYCRCPVSEYARFVKSFEFSAPSIRIHRREGEWLWFNEAKGLPGEAKPHAMGVMPLAGMVISDKALSAIVRLFDSEPLWRVFCELRIATAAAMLGYPPVANPMGGSNLCWQPLAAEQIRGRNIFHPVKHVHKEK